jgi:addiction module HigA family antidote
MFNPPHPGEILLDDVLPALDIDIAEFARRLGYAPQALLRVMQGHAPVDQDLAMGLERTGIGSTKVWLAVQADWDLWQAQSANK